MLYHQLMAQLSSDIRNGSLTKDSFAAAGGPSMPSMPSPSPLGAVETGAVSGFGKGNELNLPSPATPEGAVANRGPHA